MSILGESCSNLDENFVRKLKILRLLGLKFKIWILGNTGFEIMHISIKIRGSHLSISRKIKKPKISINFVTVIYQTFH